MKTIKIIILISVGIVVINILSIAVRDNSARNAGLENAEYHSKGSLSFRKIIAEGDINKIMELILQKNINAYYDSQTLLIFAVESDNIKVVEFLIEKGANINKKGIGCFVYDIRKNARGSCHSPLYQAVLNGNKEIAELLIKNGANVNVKNESQESPLSIAKKKGNKEIIALLIANGAKE